MKGKYSNRTTTLLHNGIAGVLNVHLCLHKWQFSRTTFLSNWTTVEYNNTTAMLE